MDHHVREPTGKLLSRLHESLGEAFGTSQSSHGQDSFTGEYVGIHRVSSIGLLGFIERVSTTAHMPPSFMA